MSRTLARTFRAHLREHAISQAEAARRLDVSPAILSLYLNGSGQLSRERVDALENEMQEMMLKDDELYYQVYAPVIELLGKVPWHVRHRLVRDVARIERSSK